MELVCVINTLEVHFAIHVSMEEMEHIVIFVNLVSLDQIVKHVLVKMEEFVIMELPELEHVLVFQDFLAQIVECQIQQQLEIKLELQLELKVQQLRKTPAAQHPSSFLESFL